MLSDSTGPQSASANTLELPRTPPPRERADAARNRAAVLQAAAGLFAEHGVTAVSMDQVAAAAGVGKGTIFRRFGDKAGLAVAAFTIAYLDYLLEHLELVRMSETAAPGARYRIGAYRFWHRHVAILLGGSPDPEHAAHAFLAALAAEHVSAVLPELGEARVRAGLARLARAAARDAGQDGA